MAIDTTGWNTSPSLVINYAHTVEYRCDWYVNGTIWKSYDFPTCDGWISDVFISGSGARARVGWNLVTNAMYTEQDGSYPYDSSIAYSAASWATQTIFPAGDLNNLDIR